MKLTAAIPVRNELSRYLDPCVAHLLEFVDEVRLLDDGSDDGWQEALRGAWGKAGAKVYARTRERGGVGAFYKHASARQALLDFTLEGAPTHILNIDADEFVSDGALVRQACEEGAQLASLEMCEVWEPCAERLCVRRDGGWAPHPVGMVWAPDPRMRGRYRIRDRGPATGRTPEDLWRRRPQWDTGAACFHFGWAREEERVARAARYAEADGGRYHAKAHLDSILWPPSKVKLEGWAWPAVLEPLKAGLLERSGREAARIEA